MDSQRFAIKGRVIGADDPQLQDALAHVYDRPERPRCLCVPGGVEMYVARHRQFVVKRMPDSGSAHHPGCPSYEPEVQQSGLGELVGEAVLESEPGRVELRVDFPWMRVIGRGVPRGEPQEVAEIGVPRRQMTLRALMHFLFERAGFNRWSPAMAGKRNQGVLRKYPLGAAALADLESIRDNPAPYGQIPRIDALIKTVEGINESAAQVKRERALNSIDVKIAEVVKSLGQVQASADLRNKALYPLQELKTKVAGLLSIPKIMYLQEQAGTLLDDAMGVIEKASQQAAPKAPSVVKDSGATTTSTVLTTAPKSVAPKPSKVIRAADLSPTIYLETEAEVETFITKLKAELLDAIKAGQRARIS